MMKNNLSKKTIALAGAAVLLTAGLNVGGALSYFTAYTEAAGSARIELGTPAPGIEETFDKENWIKTVTVTNSGSVPCYVRIKVVAGELHTPGAEDYEYDKTKWTLEDGCYYYRDVLQPGDSAGTFRIHVPVPAADAEDFNVIVVEEYTPALYDENGNFYADWTLEANKEVDG